MDLLASKKSVRISMSIFFILLSLIGIIDSGTGLSLFLSYILRFLFGKAYIFLFLGFIGYCVVNLLNKKRIKMNKMFLLFLFLLFLSLCVVLSSHICSGNYFKESFSYFFDAFKQYNNDKFINLFANGETIGGGFIGYLIFAILGTISNYTVAFIFSIIVSCIFLGLTIYFLVKFLLSVEKEYKEEVKEIKTNNQNTFIDKDVKIDDVFVENITSVHKEVEIQETITTPVATDVDNFDVTKDDIFKDYGVNQKKISYLSKTNYDVLDDGETINSSSNVNKTVVSGFDLAMESDEIFEELKKENNVNQIEDSTYNNFEEEEIETTIETPVMNERPTPVINENRTPVKKKHWELPPVSLLTDPVYQDSSINDIQANENDYKINQKLESLNIPGKVVEHLVSPSFTRYRIQFDPRYKIKALKSVEADLQSVLESTSISILTPIPGESYSGIDVPNKVRRTVTFKECFTKIPYDEKDNKMIAAIGVNSLGKTIILDLKKAQHMLVAGMSGSGKSCGLNSIISSLAMRATPDDVRLLLIDPKLNEFKLYNSLPHLLCPVIQDPVIAAKALKKLVDLINERNIMISAINDAVDIDSYNDYQSKTGGEKIPYIICVIDEFQFLVEQNRAELESYIKSIAAVGRSVGVFIICCTQSPRADIITGNIKANLSTTMCFWVRKMVDSQVVIDEPGAEKLLSMGDMLLSLAGSNVKDRVQGCFVSISEKKNITDFWASQGPGEYDPDFINLQPDIPEQVDYDLGGIDKNDPIYKAIKRYLLTVNDISTSKLQRKFSLGQPKAAKFTDWLEEEGIIGPLVDNKPRMVFQERLKESMEKGD